MKDRLCKLYYQEHSSELCPRHMKFCNLCGTIVTTDLLLARGKCFMVQHSVSLVLGCKYFQKPAAKFRIIQMAFEMVEISTGETTFCCIKRCPSDHQIWFINAHR